MNTAPGTKSGTVSSSSLPGCVCRKRSAQRRRKNAARTHAQRVSGTSRLGQKALTRTSSSGTVCASASLLNWRAALVSVGYDAADVDISSLPGPSGWSAAVPRSHTQTHAPLATRFFSCCASLRLAWYSFSWALTREAGVSGGCGARSSRLPTGRCVWATPLRRSPSSPCAPTLVPGSGCTRRSDMFRPSGEAALTRAVRLASALLRALGR